VKNLITITPPETAELDTQSSVILEQARAIVVTNAEESEAAGQFLRGIKTLQDLIVDKFAEPKDASNKAHKSIVAMEKEHLQPLKDAENIVKKQLSAFLVAEEARRQKEQAKLLKNAKQGQEVVVLDEVARPAGVQLRETWRAEVVDFMALVKAVAAGKAPPSYLLANEPLLNQQARALKAELRLPGVKAVKEAGVAAKGL